MCLVAPSCLTLCDPTDCSPPGSSVHGDSPGKNTGVDCHALLQKIFPTQGLNPGLLHCRQILYHLSHRGSPLYHIVHDISSLLEESPLNKCESKTRFHRNLTLRQRFMEGCLSFLWHDPDQHPWGFWVSDNLALFRKILLSFSTKLFHWPPKLGKWAPRGTPMIILLPTHFVLLLLVKMVSYSYQHTNSIHILVICKKNMMHVGGSP